MLKDFIFARCLIGCLSVVTVSGIACNQKKDGSSGGDVCKQFSDYESQSSRAIEATVPFSERKAATTNQDKAKWMRKLQAALEEESKKPPLFNESKLKAFEVRWKGYLGQQASALKDQANALEKNDMPGMEAAIKALRTIEEAKGSALKEWAVMCAKP